MAKKIALHNPKGVILYAVFPWVGQHVKQIVGIIRKSKNISDIKIFKTEVTL